MAQLVKNLPVMWESLIPGLGRSPGEGRWERLPTQYSWASLVAQLVKNPPAMWESSIPGLGRSPGEGRRERLPTAASPGEFHGLYSLWGCKELDMTERLNFFILPTEGGIIIIIIPILPNRNLRLRGSE